MKISIVIPTYNRPKFLGRLLKSICDQTYLLFEVIIVNDNSDCIKQYEIIIDKYRTHFPNITHIINKENKGAPFSRNIGIQHSVGEWIAFVDDDDIWTVDKLKDQVELIKSSQCNNLGIVYGYADAIDTNGDLVYKFQESYKGNCKKEILNKCFISSPTVIVKSDVFRSVGYFDESLPSCQDWDMWTRIMISDYQCDCVKKICALYCMHDDGRIGDSPNALLGYQKYYIKHLWSILRYGQIKRIWHLIKILIK